MRGSRNYQTDTGAGIIQLQRWFDREFPATLSLDAFPFVVERLRGGPARVESRTASLTRSQLTEGTDDAWSIQEHVGHLGDLEPLWIGRVEDLLHGKPELRAADLTNRATDDAAHNEAPLDTLLANFRSARTALVGRLDQLSVDDAGLTALHPRLRQPMRMIDLCTFVAEHDDHHLALVTRILRGLTS